MAYESIRSETRGAVGVIALHRPQARNALNAALITELSRALDGLEADDDIGAIVITGDEKAFAAGADIKEMQPKTFAGVLTEDLMAGDWLRLAACRKPTVAAVAGFALGGGCELAMMCDMILAAEDAKFGQPEIRLGTIPGIGGSQRLARAVGKAKAMEMVLTGRMMDAAEAERAGTGEPYRPRRGAAGRGGEARGRDRQAFAPGGDDGQGGGEPRLRDAAFGGADVRAPPVPFHLRHQGPGRGHGRLR